MAGWSMTPRDLANLLLRKAREDAHLVRSVGVDPEAADWAVGFHAQQAVEKALKAVLTALGVRHGKTHDLDELLKLVAGTQVVTPEWAAEAAALNPFGVLLRYAEIDIDQPLDRAAVIPLVERIIAWAAERVAELGSP